ncbi:MAG TPA: hypothetical protein VK158_03400 [Acidobacteriota bacterium]|nr:hypothetical protein [Acidobacteriota bacterium]
MHAVTWVMADRSLEGMLQSRVRGVAWEIDDANKRLHNPTQFSHNVKLHVPFFISKYFIVSEQMQTLKDSIRRELSFKRSESKLVDPFLDSINKEIFVQEVESSERVGHVIMPRYAETLAKRIFTGTLQFNHYNLYQMQAEAALNFPFGIIKINDGAVTVTPDVVPFSYIKNSMHVSYDSEADNWKKVAAPQSVRDLELPELEKHFATVAALDPTRKAAAKVGFLNRKEMLLEIDRIMDLLKGEKQTLHIVGNSTQGHFVGEYKFPSSVLVPHPGKDRNVPFTSISFDSQSDILTATEQKFLELQPLVVMGQNIYKYDYAKPKQLQGRFNIGTHGEAVMHRSQIQNGFVVRKEVPGRLTIDAMGYAQHFLPLPNNKLDTQHQYYTGATERKPMTHDELFVVGKRAQQGDDAALELLARYGGQDILKTEDIYEAIIDEHIVMARLNRSIPGRLDTVSKKQRHCEYWMRRFFEFHKRYGRDVASYPFDDSTDPLIFKNFSSYIDMQKRFEEYATLKSTKGISNAYWTEIHFISSIFEPLLRKDPDVAALFDLRNRSPAKTQARISRELESLAEFPYYAVFAPTITNERFCKLFGLDSSTDWLDDYQGRVETALEIVAQTLDAATVLNKKAPIYMTKSLLDPFLESRLCTALGEPVHACATTLGFGSLLSGDTGRFGFNLDGQLLSPGIADPKSRKGERCEFEKQCYKALLEKIVLANDVRGALVYVADRARVLADGLALDSELPDTQYSFESKRDYTAFSARANSGRIVQARSQRVRKGEQFSYTYDYDKMYEKFFGLTANSREGELDLGDAALGEATGTVSSVVEWLFPKRTPIVNSLLVELYRGNSSVVDDLVEYVLRI